MQLSKYDMECLAKVKDIIDKDYSVHHNIDTLAYHAGIGTTKLKKGFKNTYGLGIYQYLKEQRLQQAMRAIKEGNKTIKQIAKDSGFRHANNFIAAFKQRFGITPGKVKKEDQGG
ncbi:MAG: AraC family transcriptional regulator [Ferruginibacter sp.]